MVRISNGVFVFFNCLTLLLGLATVVWSAYIHVHGGTECQKVAQNPLMITGLFLFIVSVMGLIGSCCRSNLVLFMYLVVMFVLIVGMIGFTLFVFVVTNAGAGKVMSGKGFKEYRLGDYSNWLRNHFVNGKKWDQIRSCLIDAQVCKSLAKDVVDPSVEAFYKKSLSPIQSGCCKPPTDCGLEYKNTSIWIAPQSGPAVIDSDCTTWSNNKEKLCYYCNSCKGGVLANIRNEWRHLAIFNIIVILVIIFVYSTGCCVRRNNREDQYQRYKHHP
ncbi:Tetraspannin domain-containing protein [Cephalotus follicularis]|uniref:Tetraspannin domain-containing protein n=1 Tax=Cephalotus follicularis TaxID=3775 RepID=A0A1Q3CVZ4_CEPFO|nr:Tetraspannin domain-containing protein [Cephalotus follicularis]